MRYNLWSILKGIASLQYLSPRVKAQTLSNLQESITKSFNEYSKLSIEDKNKRCIELAQRMGYKSSDINECSKFIKNYAFSQKTKI